MKKLGEITSWSSGGTPPKDNPLFWDGDIPWISASSMRGVVYSDSELKITEVGLKKGSKLAKKGTLLILVRGSMLFNKIPIGIVSRDVAFNQDVKSIVVNNYSISEYILNWFGAFESKILNMVTGTGIGAGKLDLLDLKALEVKIPSLLEQQKIASFISLIHERIQTQSKIIEELKVLKNSISKKIFTQQLRFKDENGNDFPDWEVKKLGDVLNIQGGYAFKSNSFNQGTTKVIRIGDIYPTIKLADFSGVFSFEIPNEKYIVKKNDFVMALSGATFGKVGKIIDEGLAYINQRVAAFRTKQCLEFYYQLVQTANFKSYINSIPTASAQPNISNDDIANYKTLIPNIVEQKRVANFLSSIDHKIEVENLLLNKLQTQKQYLLSNLFI